MYNIHTTYIVQFQIRNIPTLCAVVIDAYPNTTTVEQGTTLILVCRVVGVPSTTVLSYQWTCPGGYCDAGAVDPQWAARIQQGNILVVNVRRANADNGAYTCTVMANTQQVGAATYTLSVASEYAIALSRKRKKAISISKLACYFVVTFNNKKARQISYTYCTYKHMWGLLEQGNWLTHNAAI